jgi:hypothetical protein
MMPASGSSISILCIYVPFLTSHTVCDFVPGGWRCGCDEGGFGGPWRGLLGHVVVDAIQEAEAFVRDEDQCWDVGASPLLVQT